MAQIIERLRKNGKKAFLVRIRMKGHPEAAASTWFTEKNHLLHVVFKFVQNITNAPIAYWL